MDENAMKIAMQPYVQGLRAQQSPTQNVASQTRHFPLTDLGNAERFVTQHAGKVWWCEQWKTWLTFDGRCLKKDDMRLIDILAKQTVRSIYKEANDMSLSTEQKKAMKRHAKKSESNGVIRAMLERAKSEMPIRVEQLDTHLHLLNFANGTIDLRTSVLQPHNVADMLTRCLKTAYNPDAKCPKFLRFLLTICKHDKELARFLLRALGMSISGDISEQCVFLCYGGGNNGKTTLLEVVRLCLEDYAQATDISTFLLMKSERINTDVADLYGVRFSSTGEPAIGGTLNESFIKSVTGGTPIRARHLNENFAEFMPECTIWMAFNHKPIVRDTTKGMWRRVHFIPFLYDFPDKNVILDYARTVLFEEAEGILALLVKECKLWYEKRLEVPESIRTATKAYKDESDFIGNFLANECEFKEETFTKVRILNERLEMYCKENGYTYDKRTSPKMLHTRLLEMSYHSRRGTGGKYQYDGIQLKSITEEDDEQAQFAQTLDDDSERSEQVNVQKSELVASQEKYSSNLHATMVDTTTVIDVNYEKIKNEKYRANENERSNVHYVHSANLLEDVSGDEFDLDMSIEELSQWQKEMKEKS